MNNKFFKQITKSQTKYSIKKYVDYKSISSNEVYTLFKKNGILQILNEDYEILHGYGFEYIIHNIEEILERNGA